MDSLTLGCIDLSIPGLERAADYLALAADKETGRRWLKLSSGATSITRLVGELDEIINEICAPTGGLVTGKENPR